MGKIAINPDLLSDLRHGLNNHIGENNSITSTSIIQKLSARGHKGLNGAVIRAHIHHLRTGEKMLICSSSNGYFVPKNEIEAKETIRHLYSRIKEMSEVAECLKEAYRLKFSQASLFE